MHFIIHALRSTVVEQNRVDNWLNHTKNIMEVITWPCPSLSQTSNDPENANINIMYVFYNTPFVSLNIYAPRI